MAPSCLQPNEFQHLNNLRGAKVKLRFVAHWQDKPKSLTTSVCVRVCVCFVCVSVCVVLGPCVI